MGAKIEDQRALKEGDILEEDGVFGSAAKTLDIKARKKYGQSSRDIHPRHKFQDGVEPASKRHLISDIDISNFILSERDEDQRIYVVEPVVKDAYGKIPF